MTRALPERRNRPVEFLLIAVLGGCFGAALTLAFYIGAKVGAALVAAALAVAAVAAVRDRERLLLALFAISIPINLGKTVLLEPHLGGAPGLRVSTTDFAVFCLYVIWLYEVAILRRGRLALPKALTSPALAVIGTSIVSTACGVNPKLGVFEIVRLAQVFALMAYFATRTRSNRQLRIILWTLLAAIVFQGMIAVLQYKSDHPIGLTFFGESREVIDVELPGSLFLRRVGGTLGGDNILGAWLALALPLCLTCAVLVQDWRVRAGSLAAFAAGSGALLLTLSRGAWLGFAAAIVATSIALLWKRRVNRNTVVLFATFMVVLCVALVPVRHNVRDRIVRGSPVAKVSRIVLLKTSAQMFAAHPIFGVGTNNFAEAMHDGYDKSGILRSYGMVAPVHNIYVLSLVDTGLVGLAAFAWLLFAIGRECLGAMRRSRDPLRLAFAIGISCGLAAHLIHGMVDIVYTFAPIKATVWLYAGLAVALNRWPAGETSRGGAAAAAS